MRRMDGGVDEFETTAGDRFGMCETPQDVNSVACRCQNVGIWNPTSPEHHIPEHSLEK